MRIAKDVLQSYNLFDSLPPEFKSLSGGDYFVMYYTTNEKELKLNVFDYDVVKQVNVSLYRGLSAKEDKNNVISLNIAYFSGDTYETRDGIFFLFLRTYNSAESVEAFYRDIMQQDTASDINISINAVTDIYSPDDFRKSLSYFSPNRIQSIMFVYDMVADAFKRRLSTDLYGGMIKKVVNLIKYDGGVLNELGGELRYMVIGEHSRLNKNQAVKLNAAKILLRSMQSPEEIYKSTGWYFSDKDGKWRTNISDDEAAISEIYLSDVQGRKLYRPSAGNSTNEDVLSLVGKPERIYAYNYQGKLSEVLKHPTLYEYYPQLANLPILYFVSDDTTRDFPQEFYYAPNDRGGYIVINGSNLYGPILSTLLHETQHAVQRIEDFATGGNEFVARFVASIGGKSVRKVFSSVNRLERFFKENLLSDSSRIELLAKLNKERPRNDSAASALNQLLPLMQDFETYSLSYKNINFLLAIYIAENKDFANNGIVIYLNNIIGDIIFDLIGNISSGYNEAMVVMTKLSGDGFKKDDIQTILFASYQNLYGEMESRSVQASRYVTSEYKNYFWLTEWERSPIKQLVVIDGIETVIDTKSIKAAVEKKGDEYVMHFSKSASCVPFLHELGHMVHDGMIQAGFGPDIEKCYENNYSFEDIGEYFVSRFLGYIGKNIDDDNIANDMKVDFSIDSEPCMNELFDSFFTESGYDERLEYLQTLLVSII